jgi:putative monooxygenase
MSSETSTHPITKVAAADVPPNRKRGGDLRVMLSPRSVGATSGFMGCGTLLPGEFVSEHYHPYSEEFFYVVSGTMTVKLNGKPIEVGPDEGLMIPIGHRHRIENHTGQPVTVVFHCGPLAPRPDLGHVDCEELPGPGALPVVGGAP